MGFTTGFTGGVTLTLSIAYLTVLAHQRNREQQAAILRQQTRLLSGVVDPLPPALPPTRAELAAAERANLIETAKDRWNAEVESAVRWAQNKDWEGTRDGLEGAIGRAWTRFFGDAQQQAQEGVRNAEQKTEAAVRNAADRARGELQRDAAASKRQAENVAGGVAAAAKSAYADAKVRGAEAVSKTEDKAQEARGSVLDAIGKGIDKGREVFGKARSAVVDAEDKVETKLADKLPPTSPAEKALRQRYEETPRGLDRTAEEVLAARYIPVDNKDNTNLKAL
ncbi:Uu.00g099640.m01.CDS01 [Anthostomella pinea]|uniref:MICOS complex subunit MIC12 n=1 Tax=Anthostomella pinea TaxID=933095 RepID=A0AAI8VDT8_9PEZI|nr:Uu.00g099640.m01.CDS01 [Anthostomella pinea]